MRTHDIDADVIVVGLGAMGAATSYHAARMGLSVLGIDRYDPPHEFGSSHAETRISRLAVGEGPQYLPFVTRSHELWRELEERTGEPVFHESGGIIVTEPTQHGTRWNDFATVTAGIARKAGIEYSLLAPEHVRARHPLLNVPAENRVGFEPTAGLVMSERAVALQIQLARSHGATIRTGELVLAVEPEPGCVSVRTDRGTYRASRVVLAAGPWMETLAPPFRDLLTVTRQVVYWFEADDLDAYSTDRFPFVMWIGGSVADYMAVFPRPPGTTNGVKLLGEQFVETTTADQVDRTVGAAEIDDFYERLVEPRVQGIRPRCVRTAVCLYTNTPDDHFVVDTDPRSDRILVMSPCSGHGFKHSAALGEAVAELLATGSSTRDLGAFAAPV